MSTTPMIGPDGSIADVPHGSVKQAIQAGAKIAFDMVSPDGQQRAAVPLESMHAAIAAGATLAQSSAGDFAAASVSRPADPLQHVTGYDLLGPLSDSFSTRVGNRIQQNLESLADVPAELGRETAQAASSPHSVHALINNTAGALRNTLAQTWKDWHDPANVAGDVVTGIMGGAATEGTTEAASAASTVAKPAELSLIPKLTRAYDTLQAIGGGAHAPELAPVLDGLNDLSTRVIERIQQPETTPAQAPTGNTLSSLLQGRPNPRSFRDVQEDAEIQNAMESDLEQHGEAARLEQSRDFIANNSVTTPKWQRVLDAKISALIEEAEQKQTTSPAVKPYSPKSKAAAAAAGAGGDDLTDILKASLDVARKKKSIN